MPAENDISGMLATPLLGDQDPWRVNMHTLNGFAAQMTKDGVAYRIIGCNELNMFADRGVYLAICSGVSELNQAFEVDKNTHRITPKADYDEFLRWLNFQWRTPQLKVVEIKCLCYDSVTNDDVNLKVSKNESGNYFGK